MLIKSIQVPQHSRQLTDTVGSPSKSEASPQSHLEILPNEVKLIVVKNLVDVKDKIAISELSRLWNFFLKDDITGFPQLKKAYIDLRNGLRENNKDKVLQALILGALPSNFNQTIKVEDSRGCSKTLSLIELLLENCQFEIADFFLKKGAVLPEIKISMKVENGQTLSNYFKLISLFPAKIYIALKKEPELANKKDCHGKTLLDHCRDSKAVNLSAQSRLNVLKLFNPI